MHFNWTLGNKDTPNCYHAFPSSFCQNFLHPKKAAQGTVCLNRLPSHHRNPHILVPFIIVSPVKHTLMDHSLLDRSWQVTRLKARLGCAKKKKKWRKQAEICELCRILNIEIKIPTLSTRRVEWERRNLYVVTNCSVHAMSPFPKTSEIVTSAFGLRFFVSSDLD